MLTTDLDETRNAQLLKGINIPPQPQILQFVMTEKQKPNPNIRMIATEVSKDVGMSAAMLRTVNSSAFGLRKKVASIPHAVMLLGLNNSVNLITGLALRMAMTSKSRINLNRFWDTAMDTALICTALARHFKLMDTDQAHMLGLFHDCGLPLMMQRFSNYAEKLIDNDANAKALIVDLEEQHFNTNHALIGYLIARSWGLPEDMRLVILNHHNEDLLKNANHDALTSQVFMLTLASHLCHLYHYESEDTIWLRIGPDVMQFFNLSDTNLKDINEDIIDGLSAS